MNLLSCGGLRVFHIAALHVLIVRDLVLADLGLRLVLWLLILLLLSCEHIHTVSAHEDWTEMAHVLGLATDVMGDAKHYSVRHHLVLLLLLADNHLL